EAAVQSAATAETAARNASRDRQREANAARDRYEAAEREANRNAARLSALAEGRVRLTANREEAEIGRTQAEEALSGLAPAAELEGQLAAVRDDITAKRGKLAEVRAEQQAIVREAELADRRLAQLSSDKAGWNERRDGARGQITTLEQRIAEAKSDRAEIENAPAMFAEKRSGLISEVETAEAARRACADRLQEAEN